MLKVEVFANLCKSEELFDFVWAFSYHAGTNVCCDIWIWIRRWVRICWFDKRLQDMKSKLKENRKLGYCIMWSWCVPKQQWAQSCRRCNDLVLLELYELNLQLRLGQAAARSTSQKWLFQRISFLRTDEKDQLWTVNIITTTIWHRMSHKRKAVLDITW